jgi:glutaredoxin
MAHLAARAACVLAALALLPAPSGCSRRRAGDDAAAERSLPPLHVKDDTPDLMLTWIDDKGSTHVELHPADVPAAGRALVRVVVSDREDGTRELFYVADLSTKRDDGEYATRTMPRREWESEIEKRREANLPKPAPSSTTAPRLGPDDRPAPPAAERGAAAVIIYGASWCGPCHQAADYLKSKGIAYVLKDIEETPGAAGEMREKLARVGQHGGSIPVIDVRGQILVGFSPSSVDRALAKTAGVTL